MSNRSLGSKKGATWVDQASQVLGIGVIFAWGIALVMQNPRPAFTSRFECGSDPWDILRIGEILDPGSLAFIVRAHCTNARYSPDGWIELSYGGGRVDVELQRVDIGGRTHFRIVSIGGVSGPE